MTTTELFTGHAADYAKGRPGYPPALLDFLAAELGVGPDAVVADIGAGTGIFSAQLLGLGARVVCVEPNDDMRAQAEATLGHNPRASFSAGTAEATGLAAASADVITVAQAFHWFDPAAFRTESRRILRPGGQAALVWNNRVADAAVNAACAEVFARFCPRFKGFSGGMLPDDPRLDVYFADGYERRIFANPLRYTRQQFIARCLSGSYSLLPGDADFDAYLATLHGIFDAHAAREGEADEAANAGEYVEVPNETVVYWGRV